MPDNSKQSKSMKRRILREAIYMIKFEPTVRQMEEVFDYSHVTIYKDLTERLQDLNPAMASRVRDILAKHKQDRHIKGGESTRKLYRDGVL